MVVAEPLIVHSASDWKEEDLDKLRISIKDVNFNDFLATFNIVDSGLSSKAEAVVVELNSEKKSLGELKLFTNEIRILWEY